jgi:hypothetical protein
MLFEQGLKRLGNWMEISIIIQIASPFVATFVLLMYIILWAIHEKQIYRFSIGSDAIKNIRNSIINEATI